MMDPKAAEALLKECGAFLTGHFVLSSGLHSPAYVQCAQLFQHPGRAGIACAALADQWREEAPDVVVGPALGGILVAYETARALGARALFMERKDGVMRLRRGFSVGPQDRILVAEDIVTSGKSVQETLAALESLGGEIVGVAAIGNRSGGNPFDLPFRYLLDLDFPVYEPEACPLCKEGKPIEKPGSRSG